MSMSGGSAMCPPDPLCVLPEITSAGIAAGQVGLPFSFRIEVTGDPVEITFTGKPLWADFDPSLSVIYGIPNVTGVSDITITAANSCGMVTSHLLISIGTNLLIFGNWQSPVPVTFTEAQIMDSTTNWAQNANGHQIVNAAVRQRTIEFSEPPAGADWFQVIFIPDAMLVEPPPFGLSVQGFTFNLQPANNTPYQSLTVAGVPGKIFVSAAANNGGFSILGGNPMVIS